MKVGTVIWDYFGMKNEDLRQEFAARLKECFDESEIYPYKYVSTMAIWLGKPTKNPMFARKWLSGESMPTKSNLKVLAQNLEVREEWLEYGTGSKYEIDAERQKYIDQVTDLLESMSAEDVDKAIKVLKVYAGS